MNIEMQPTANAVELIKEDCITYYDENSDEFKKGDVSFFITKNGGIRITAPTTVTSLDINDFEEVVRVYKSYFDKE